MSEYAEENREKLPYQLGKKKTMKNPTYRSLIRGDLADQLYDKIVEKIIVQKKYKEANYLAKDLAKELNTNTRYLSAVINSRFGMNYSNLVNTYRIRESLHLLIDKRQSTKNIEEISALVGFSNRQSFYAAFYKQVGMPPNDFRKQYEKESAE